MGRRALHKHYTAHQPTPPPHPPAHTPHPSTPEPTHPSHLSSTSFPPRREPMEVETRLFFEYAHRLVEPGASLAQTVATSLGTDPHMGGHRPEFWSNLWSERRRFCGLNLPGLIQASLPGPELVESGPVSADTGPNLVQRGPELVHPGPTSVDIGPVLVEVGWGSSQTRASHSSSRA